jgi:hypothetical protein
MKAIAVLVVLAAFALAPIAPSAASGTVFCVHGLDGTSYCCPVPETIGYCTTETGCHYPILAFPPCVLWAVTSALVP